MLLFVWVLWHINHCRLFNAISHLYIYIEYIWFCLVGFYGISTIVGCLMPNPLNSKYICFVQYARRDELWQYKSRLLHHNNAPAVMEQPSYLPDFAPWDFFYSQSSKGSSRLTILKAWRPLIMELRGIPKESFQHGIGVWQRRLRLERNYFEVYFFVIKINWL